MTETKFADGIFWNNKRENAPDFVIGSISILKEKALEFIQNEPANEKGYINLDVLNSKEGKPYVKVNDYQKQADTPHPASSDTPGGKEREEDINPEDIPF